MLAGITNVLETFKILTLILPPLAGLDTSTVGGRSFLDPLFFPSALSSN